MTRGPEAKAFSEPLPSDLLSTYDVQIILYREDLMSAPGNPNALSMLSRDVTSPDGWTALR